MVCADISWGVGCWGWYVFKHIIGHPGPKFCVRKIKNFKQTMVWDVMTVGRATSKHFLEIVAFQVQVKHICDQPLSSGLRLLYTFVDFCSCISLLRPPNLWHCSHKNKSYFSKMGKTKSFIDLKSQFSGFKSFNFQWCLALLCLGAWPLVWCLRGRCWEAGKGRPYRLGSVGGKRPNGWWIESLLWNNLTYESLT